MGQVSKSQSNKSANGASLLVIDQTCDNDQLLVSLSKNETEWLSPVGWTHQQKVTLLDCRPNGETTEVDIPAEFASDIKTGDILVLRCSELDLEKEIIWESSEIQTRKVEDASTVSSGLTGGLLSRFKTSKAEVVGDKKSEAELRAEEADRAAQNYKAKMDAATAAKEQAHRKALEAAREAEAALKMEADRIAEMERAAKAFEDAERLKQDELRRVEEERRAEDARLAEETRRIETARKREIAAKEEAERKAAIERYEVALDIKRDEELRLKSRLTDLKLKAKTDTENYTVQAEDLQSRQSLLVNTEEMAIKFFGRFEKSASKLDAINADVAMLQTKSETLNADRLDMSSRLSQADLDYQQAQTEMEAALARAEARKAELDIIRQEDNDISEKVASISDKLLSQNKLALDASEKTQKLQLKYESTQADLAQAKVEIEALEQVLNAQVDQDHSLRMEIEATQQSIEDSQAHIARHQEAIDHLKAGGVAEDIAYVDFEARNFESNDFNFVDEEVSSVPLATADKTDLKDRIVGRVRRSFARQKDAEISIEVEDVALDSDVKDLSVFVAPLDETPSFISRHSTRLMAIGAVIGGIAIVTGGYALNKTSSPKFEVKSNAVAPTQVASAVEKVEMPKTSDFIEAKEVSKVVNENVLTKADLSVIEVPKPKALEIKRVKADLNVQPAAEDKSTAVEIKEDTFVTKLAEVVDPIGFAFDLPDMMTVVQPKQSPSKKQSVKNTAVTKEVAAPKVEVQVNYPELTSDVQTRLQGLGFYNAEINGFQTKATKEAIKSFKTLFAMPVDDRITGALLTEIKRAEREQEASNDLATAQAKIEVQPTIQVAEAVPVVTYHDTVQPVPTAPVVRDSLPATTPDFPAVAVTTPAYVEPESGPVLEASIPEIVTPASAPIVQDVIVEAKILKNASAKYPAAAQRRNLFVNVAIVVDYDIDASGRASNINIASNDYSGRYQDAFEKEAVRAVEKMRYEPKTVNGTAVEVTGNQKRIVFRTE